MDTRPIEPKDADIWLAMRQALWPDAGMAELAAEIAAFFGGQGQIAAVYLCCETPERIVGFVELSLRSYAEGCRSSPVPYVEGWYVVPEARRRGAGGSLIRAAERWACAGGHVEIASDAQIANAISHDAHRAVGFEEVERAVHFRKALAP